MYHLAHLCHLNLTNHAPGHSLHHHSPNCVPRTRRARLSRLGDGLDGGLELPLLLEHVEAVLACLLVSNTQHGASSSSSLSASLQALHAVRPFLVPRWFLDLWTSHIISGCCAVLFTAASRWISSFHPDWHPGNWRQLGNKSTPAHMLCSWAAGQRSSSGQARLAGPNKHSAGPGCRASSAAPRQRLQPSSAGPR